MVRNARSKVAFRRRREGKTDFRHRLALLKSNKPRAVVRSSNRFITVQFIEFTLDGDNVIAAATSEELPKFGWSGALGNLPSAYLAGKLAAKRAKSKSVSDAVLDIGLHKPSKGAKVFAALKGILDEGIKVPHNKEILPDAGRISGKHINEQIPKKFNEVKAAIEQKEK